MTYRIVFTALIITLLSAGAATRAHAQAPAVQRAFEEVRTKLDDLVSAKDENFADDLALRIQAFKKVIEFSAEEAKTLKVKLLAAEFEEAEKGVLAAWKARIEGRLAEASAYYEKTLGVLTTSTTPIDLKGVRASATSFKEWRGAAFLPLAGEVGDFLLVVGQRHALEVTEARFAKIESDVRKLERAKIKGVGILSVLLAKAAKFAESARTSYEHAESLFVDAIAPPVPPADESASSTASAATGTIARSNNIATSTATSTLTENKEPVKPPSIRDEIKTSLEAVKDTYHTFIAMSVEVKKILK
ncbi:MAG: hypothetical protein Q8P88_00500 [Candidatus Jorgensenbacteria bacterium]|nr:hypothetical protein [Candidatus Jorgensenbacteria bacterium]